MPAKNSSSDDLRKALADYVVHVPLGAGQLLMEKGKELSKKVGSVAQDSGRSVAKTYADLAQRGEKVAKNLRHSSYARRTVDSTKAATRTTRSPAKKSS